MRHYEVMVVLAPDLAEDGFRKQLDRVTSIIENGGGNVVNDDRWGIRTLAYPIKKYDQGYYTVIEWEGAPELISELDHTLRLEEKVLRHMVIHLDATALEELARDRTPRDDAGTDTGTAGSQESSDEGAGQVEDEPVPADTADDDAGEETGEAGDDEAGDDEAGDDEAGEAGEDDADEAEEEKE